MVACNIKYRDFALVPSLTFSASREEILESRGEGNCETRARRGERKEASGGKIIAGRGNREVKMIAERKRRRRPET